MKRAITVLDKIQKPFPMSNTYFLSAICGIIPDQAPPRAGFPTIRPRWGRAWPALSA